MVKVGESHSKHGSVSLFFTLFSSTKKQRERVGTEKRHVFPLSTIWSRWRKATPQGERQYRHWGTCFACNWAQFNLQQHKHFQKWCWAQHQKSILSTTRSIAQKPEEKIKKNRQVLESTDQCLSQWNSGFDFLSYYLWLPRYNSFRWNSMQRFVP